jgi:hypothetical protein
MQKKNICNENNKAHNLLTIYCNGTAFSLLNQAEARDLIDELLIGMKGSLWKAAPCEAPDILLLFDWVHYVWTWEQWLKQLFIRLGGFNTDQPKI